ncbi:MAG TPA: FG-GAP repeat protein [Chthoniobacterales bacterium]|jgi:hypothetical protein|nr:FG-GAP repeat protein [Chthoniobacterales bacterium]
MKKIVACLLGGAALAIALTGFRANDMRKGAASEQRSVSPSGNDAARRYLVETADGRSLMQAVTAARFGLQWQEQEPREGRMTSGYLGLSHDQNLNGWFTDKGATIRPTLPPGEKERAWSVGFEPKAYGYGEQLEALPPVAGRRVVDNRIEYQRGSDFVEWYENRAEGIEHGFIVNTRPARAGFVRADEPFRIWFRVEGDLHAKLKEGGQEIEFVNGRGAATLSYSKLIALDAEGKYLAARMEASSDGREIGLVVDDRAAVYPIVIDPIVAALEQKLEAFTAQQAEARFGFAVAIDGDRAVVGAWREDFGSQPDVGVVYTFTRTGTSWSLTSRNDSGNEANDSCGWSVAISGTRVVYGCPGAYGQTGNAYLRVFGSGGDATLLAPPSGNPKLKDQYGYSVAISGTKIAVGAPYSTVTYTAITNETFVIPEAGEVYFFQAGPSGNGVTYEKTFTSYGLEYAWVGRSLAFYGDEIIMGAPGYYDNSGIAYYSDHGQYNVFRPANRVDGDSFGDSLSVSGNTIIVGAPGDDGIALDAGAAYVFIRDVNTGGWAQQQKLTASDGRAGDHFSLHAVTIEGDTIAVGANEWDITGNGDNAGAVYVFTRSGSAWTQRTALYGNAFDNFGIAVDLSKDALLVGARAAGATGGPPRAGAAYVYRLPHTLANLSTRLRVEAGDNVLIGGFIVTGTHPKKVILRAIGPSLPLPDKLANPMLELYQGNTRIASNDNWMESADKQAIIDSGVPPTNDLEAAIVVTLPANNSQYTAIVRGANDGTGIGLVEAYDLDGSANSSLANIATRGLVQTGDNVLFAGTIVLGATSQKVIIRALGPSVPVNGKMADPELELHDGNGALLESNDNWIDSANKQAIIDTGIPPTNNLESAIVRTLSPANYTAIVRGVNDTTGIAVVEVYALQ